MPSSPSPSSSSPGPQPAAPVFARFTLHIPRTHAGGEDMTSLLAAVQKALHGSGMMSHHIIQNVPHVYGEVTQQGDLLRIDAPDDQNTRLLIKAVCEGIKALSGHPAVHVTVQPLEVLTF